MITAIEEAKSLHAKAKLQRKKGDALRKAKRPEAKEAFEAGLALLEKAERTLNARGTLDKEAADVQAETLGAKGGMLDRLGRERHDEALTAYNEGSDIEVEYDLSSSYCRLNALKFQLLTGQAEFGALRDDIQLLADWIENRLRTDSKLSNSGWAWADLGDCRALLGDVSAAEAAYSNFIDKGETQSPERTLAVLNQLAETMAANGDTEAGNVQAAANALLIQLKGEEV